MFRKIVLIMLGLGLGLSACSPRPIQNEADEVVQIRLPMGYIPNVQYAPFYVAVEKGFFREANIEIEFDYSYETDGVALVGAGELPFSVVSGEQVLLARSQGLPVVYVMAWYQQYPISVISKKENGIAKPEDLAGKKIGLPGLFGANYIGLEALLFAADLSLSDVTADSIGFNQVEALATDQEEAVVVYTANEPIQLRARGYALNEIRVSDYAQLASNGILASESVIAQDPELVRAFVGAFLKGIEYALAHPDEAYSLCETHIPNFAVLDADVQKQVLATSMEMWKADRLGYSDEQSWRNMRDLLLEMGLIKEKMDVNDAFTNEFIP